MNPADFPMSAKMPGIYQDNANRGRHPLGFEVGADPTLKCGSCIFRFVKITGPQGTVRQHRCRKAISTGRQMSEVRLLWRACVHHQPSEVMP